jgi:archaellum component FlaC
MDEKKFQELVLTQFEQMNKQFIKMDQRFEKMDQRFDKVDKRFDRIEVKIEKIENDLIIVKTQVVENTRILKALEHVAEVNKAEHDRMFGDIRDIKGGKLYGGIGV